MVESLDIRSEKPGDEDAISDVIRRAFEGKRYASGTEAEVVIRLRTSGALILSLVAVSEGRIVGQVAFSEAGQADWHALGPVAVDPDCQKLGIGSALIKAGLSQLSELGSKGCILLGDPNYYSRFGFEVKPEFCPDGLPGEYFMVRQAGDHSPTGKFKFHSAFED